MHTCIVCTRAEKDLKAALDRERNELMRFENLDKQLRAQDKLLSDMNVALHALFEKLRPIKIKEVSFFLY